MANTISKAIYHNVKETKNNTITCEKLTIVYEFYNLNITDDINISDNIKTNSISANFMMFNGNSVNFNNHKITFKILSSIQMKLNQNIITWPMIQV